LWAAGVSKSSSTRRTKRRADHRSGRTEFEMECLVHILSVINGMDFNNILSGNSFMPLRISLIACRTLNLWFCEACIKNNISDYGGREKEQSLNMAKHIGIQSYVGQKLLL